jgi:flagellar basal body-associated protein FliL
MDTKKLEALRQKLVAQVTEQSEGNIYDVYFTSFVMQ